MAKYEEKINKVYKDFGMTKSYISRKKMEKATMYHFKPQSNQYKIQFWKTRRLFKHEYDDPVDCLFSNITYHNHARYPPNHNSNDIWQSHKYMLK